MANKGNTTLSIGKSADFGVMHNPDAPRARTRTRGMPYGDINNIPLTVIPRARVRESFSNISKPLNLPCEVINLNFLACCNLATT